MATNFPTSLDSLTNPAAGDSLSSPSHAAQHSNVNDAVEALQAKVGVDGSAVTGSLDYKVANQGLVLVKSQAIGSGVSSVTVTDAFSSTFDNYRILMSNMDASAIADVTLQLGSTTVNYYGVVESWSYVSGVSQTLVNNGGPMTVAIGHTASDSYATIELMNPHDASRTGITAHSGGLRGVLMVGEDTLGGSHTAFTLTMNSGTMTGGRIRVYGYNDG